MFLTVLLLILPRVSRKITRQLNRRKSSGKNNAIFIIYPLKVYQLLWYHKFSYFKNPLLV